VLDKDALAKARIATPFAEERQWIEQAPQSIKALMIYKYLEMMLKFWPTIRDRPPSIFQIKKFVPHMEKFFVGWSDLSETERRAFYHLVRPPSPYAERGKQVQKGHNRKTKLS
jgi:hypothetical protein